MKKIMILLVLGCLLFGLAAVASAETTVYLDAVVSGRYDTTDKNTIYGTPDSIMDYKLEGDLAGFILGSESAIDKFKVGMEYGKINTNDYDYQLNGASMDADKLHNNFTLAELKSGYRVVDQETWKLDLIAAVLSINSDDEENITFMNLIKKRKSNIGGNMLGADFVISLSKNISFQGTLGTSLLGANYTDYYGSELNAPNTYQDASLTEIKLKLNCFITDNFAVAMGYRSYKFSAVCEMKNQLDGSPTGKTVADGSLNIITIGAVYKF